MPVDPVLESDSPRPVAQADPRSPGPGRAGLAVVALQESLNARAAPRGYPRLATDGVLGPVTLRAVDDLCHALGLDPATSVEKLAADAAAVIRDPRLRGAGQVAAAAERVSGLTTRTIVLDGVELPWGLVKPLVRARAAGWSGRLRQTSLPTDLVEHLRHPHAAWWRRLLEVSRPDELGSILSQMGYRVESAGHGDAPFDRGQLRFTTAPGPVEPEPPHPGPFAPAGEPAIVPTPSSTTLSTSAAIITGPDVSADNGAIDWRQVAESGHRFALIKATEGVDLVDPRFAVNWPAARAAGLRRGAYHVASAAAGRDPGDEAVHLVTTVRAIGRPYPDDLPPAVVLDRVDDRLSGDELAAWVQVFADVVWRLSSCRPVIRANPAALTAAIASGLNPALGVWLTEPEPAVTDDPAALRRARLLKYPRSGHCPGIVGACELNRLDASGPDV